MCTRRQHTRCCCVVLCLVLFGLIEGWHITCNSGCCVPHDKHLKFIGSADMWATNDEDNSCQRALEHVEGSLKEIPPTILVRKNAAEIEARVNKVLPPRMTSGAVALSCRLSLRGGVSTRRSNGTAATQQARYVRDSGDGLSGQEKRGLSSRMQDMDAHHSLPLSADTRTLPEVQRWSRKLAAVGNTAISSTKKKSEEHEDDDDSEEDEDVEFEDEDLEGPRHSRASTKQSRERRKAKMLDRIAQKAQMNSTYMKDLDDELAALRKSRQHDQEVVAEEERALRDSDDTSELIRTGENITRYFQEQDAAGRDELEEDEEELDSWEQDERDEEAVRLLGSWWTLQNETDNSANITRGLKLLRRQQRAQDLELKDAAKAGDIEDTGGDIDETAHVAALESIFGEGVCAEGWLKASSTGLKGLLKQQLDTDAAGNQSAADIVLWGAVWLGNATAVRRLVEQGSANPNAKDDFFGNSTALHLAASQGHTRVVRELIRLGAQVDACDSSWGRTPLHLAVRGGHFSTVQALVAAGADANWRCHHQMTALEHAVAALLQRQMQPAGAALPDGASFDDAFEHVLRKLGGQSARDRRLFADRGSEAGDEGGGGSHALGKRIRRREEIRGIEQELVEVFGDWEASGVPIRVATEPNAAHLDEIIRYLQTEVKAEGSTLAADYEALELGLGSDLGDAEADANAGEPAQMRVDAAEEEEDAEDARAGGSGGLEQQLQERAEAAINIIFQEEFEKL